MRSDQLAKDAGIDGPDEEPTRWCEVKAVTGSLTERVAEWFDAGMDRVAGWYRRQVKYFLLAVAAVVTVAVNADTMRIAEQLWMDDALRGEIAAAAQEAVAENDLGGIDARAQLGSFPIGYPDAFTGITWRTIVGWLLTIAAISLGAPFWFDLLGKIAHLRASGGNRPLDTARPK